MILLLLYRLDRAWNHPPFRPDAMLSNSIHEDGESRAYTGCVIRVTHHTLTVFVKHPPHLMGCLLTCDRSNPISQMLSMAASAAVGAAAGAAAAAGSEAGTGVGVLAETGAAGGGVVVATGAAGAAGLAGSVGFGLDTNTTMKPVSSSLASSKVAASLSSTFPLQASGQARHGCREWVFYQPRWHHLHLCMGCTTAGATQHPAAVLASDPYLYTSFMVSAASMLRACTTAAFNAPTVLSLPASN